MKHPYIYRWDRHGRKGERCRVTARSKPTAGEPLTLAFGQPKPARFNSIRVEFSDGYAMVTSGNAIRRAEP